MYSLNVPVNTVAGRYADALHPQLVRFDAIRERHTLVVKRLGDGDVDVLHSELRDALTGTPSFEVRVTGLGVFASVPRGRAPVLYLDVESPVLFSVHQRLVDEFGAIDELEGDAYVPHVTLARGGDLDTARSVADTEIEPRTFSVTSLELYDATYREPVRRFSLPLR